MKQKLSQTLLRNSPPIPAGKSKYKVFDNGGVKGLYAEFRRTGVTFALKWKERSGRTKYVKLGVYGDITLEQARKLASELRAEIALGQDPHAARQRRKNELTFREFAETRFVPHQKVRKKSGGDDERICRKWLIPEFGSKTLSEVTTAGVSALLNRIVTIGRAPATANRVRACGGRLYELAIEWGEADTNPVKFVRPHRENNQCERFLTVDEIQRLVTAADAEPDLVGASAIVLLLVTGARAGEALGAKWSDINLVEGIWTLPDPKGGKRVHKPLNQAARDVLVKVQALRQNAFVFPGPQEGQRRKSLRAVWQRLCKKAGISGARIHDLRHTYASLLVSRGVSLFAVQRLLNHSSPTMTQRYAHWAPSDLAGENERVAQVIKAITAGGV